MSTRKTFNSAARQGCSVEFVILMLLGFLILILITSGSDQTSSGGNVNVASSPTLVVPTRAPLSAYILSTPAPVQGTPPPECQPGLNSGKMAQVVHHAVRMRYSPGYIAKDDTRDTRRYMEASDQVFIRSGPVIRDGLCWWFIEYEGLQGWTADHNRHGHLLLSVAP